MANFSMDEWYDDACKSATNAMNFVSNVDSLIFDLQDNPGGGARLGTFLASYLFERTPVHLNDYYFRTGDRRMEMWTLENIPGKRLPDVPVQILINKNTFSAAEGFAYQLKHLDRATVIGETSSGGSHGGSSHSLGNRLVVYIPFSRSIHPKTKTDYEGVGVSPDVEVASDRALDVAHYLSVKMLNEIQGFPACNPSGPLCQVDAQTEKQVTRRLWSRPKTGTPPI